MPKILSQSLAGRLKAVVLPRNGFLKCSSAALRGSGGTQCLNGTAQRLLPHVCTCPLWPCMANSSSPVCPSLGRACVHHAIVLALASHRAKRGSAKKHSASVIDHAARKMLHVGARGPIPPCRAPAPHSPWASMSLLIALTSRKTFSNLDAYEKLWWFQNRILLRYPGWDDQCPHPPSRETTAKGAVLG